MPFGLFSFHVLSLRSFGTTKTLKTSMSKKWQQEKASTATSMTGAVVGYWEDGHKTYKKSGLQARHLQGWQRCQDLGVAASYNVSGNNLLVRGGHTLQAVLEKSMVGQAGLKAIANGVRGVQQSLARGQIAHCDIKLKNVIVNWGSSDLSDPVVKLIDCDDAVAFGMPRTVVTPGVNGQPGDGQATSASTDVQGFIWILTALNEGH